MRFLFLLGIFCLSITACQGNNNSRTPEPFIAAPILQTASLENTKAPTPIPPVPTPNCEDNLRFLEDISIPDGTNTSPGEQLDKRWRVENSGSCNWNNNYALIHTTGPVLGAKTPARLYPALAGTEGELRIQFTAPAEPGIYRSAWQAVDPSGEVFGDPIFIEIVVP